MLNPGSSSSETRLSYFPLAQELSVAKETGEIDGSWWLVRVLMPKGVVDWQLGYRTPKRWNAD